MHTIFLTQLSVNFYGQAFDILTSWVSTFTYLKSDYFIEKYGCKLFECRNFEVEMLSPCIRNCTFLANNIKCCINYTDSLQIWIHFDFFDSSSLSQLARVAQLVERQAFNLNVQGSSHRQENRRLVGHFYDMKNRFWAVGCGLGWAVE